MKIKTLFYSIYLSNVLEKKYCIIMFSGRLIVLFPGCIVFVFVISVGIKIYLKSSFPFLRVFSSYLKATNTLQCYGGRLAL